MDDDAFNMSMRKFLKQVGVTSQQEIEAAVQSARDAGSLPAGPLTAHVTLRVPELGLDHTVDGQIKLDGN